jgi:hypothetical protein
MLVDTFKSCMDCHDSVNKAIPMSSTINFLVAVSRFIIIISTFVLFSMRAEAYLPANLRNMYLLRDYLIIFTFFVGFFMSVVLMRKLNEQR